MILKKNSLYSIDLNTENANKHIKILVNASALDARGAFSVMNAFLNDMNKNIENFSKYKIKMHFLAANEKLCKYENEFLKVEYINYPKKSWLHKWNYERRILPKLLLNEKYDIYLSMQSYVLNIGCVPQFVLMHQPIPFSDLKFSDIEFKNWLKYDLILKYLLKRQKKYINGIIVQTNWMKQALINKFDYNCPIQIIRPPVDDIKNNNNPLPVKVEKLFQNENIKLIYPTNSEKYKNNKRLIKAVLIFNKNHNTKVSLYLTLDGISSEYINYTGKIPYESILTFYKKTDAMIFPSLTETLGLPLLEAQLYNIPLLVSDLPYAREICGDNCLYFDPISTESIEYAIKQFVEKNYIVTQYTEMPNNSYFDYVRFILNI